MIEKIVCTLLFFGLSLMSFSAFFITSANSEIGGLDWIDDSCENKASEDAAVVNANDENDLVSVSEHVDEISSNEQLKATKEKTSSDSYDDSTSSQADSSNDDTNTNTDSESKQSKDEQNNQEDIDSYNKPTKPTNREYDALKEKIIGGENPINPDDPAPGTYPGPTAPDDDSPDSGECIAIDGSGDNSKTDGHITNAGKSGEFN